MRQLLMEILFSVSLMLFFPSLVWAGAEGDMRAGMEAYTQGRYDEAMVIFTKVIESRDGTLPRKFAAYNNRGNCWLKKGNINLAIDDFIATGMRTSALSEGDDMRVGIEAYTQGHYDEAMVIFTKVIESGDGPTVSDGKKYAAYYNRGNCWLKKGNVNRAIDDFIATDLRGFTTEFECAVLLARGTAYYRTENYEKAIEDLSKYVRSYGNDVNAVIAVNVMLLDFYYRTGDYHSMMSQFDDLIKKNLRDASAFYLRGLAWAKKGVYYKAIADFDMAIMIKPNFGEAVTERNKVLEQQRKAATER